MRKIITCEFDLDTACVELHLEDGTLLSIDCTAVENEIADSMYQRSELDWLIYNDPLAYAELILNGEPKLYLKTETVSEDYNKENVIRLTRKQIRQKQHPKRCASDGFFYILSIKANTTACCSSLNLDQRSRSFFCASVKETGASSSANS